MRPEAGAGRPSERSYREASGRDREEQGRRKQGEEQGGARQEQKRGLTWGRAAAASRGQEKSPSRQGPSGSAVRAVMESWKSHGEESEEESRSY
ncbi:protein of unknown function [Candidatus Nitrospira inopinata]|uniref:Uncharacterized protein n=1 Tax=Candidatus Nitrospira inopinata TaxID=1715989 RepID=A0A0S4KNB1_9BACT|nr:protein of unknown function [Candidatus Nitrospira inopinata]